MHSHITIFNKFHFPLKVEGYTFPPGEEVTIDIETDSSSGAFRNIRSTRGLRVGKHNNKAWKKKNMPTKIYDYNMVYDINSQHPHHRGNAYVHVIEALANPILRFLSKGAAGFVNRPVPSLNLRFFSEMRINQQGKFPVGPNDVFMSHGIGDKNYWLARKIAGFRYALVPGPAWKERIEAGGFKGEIHVVGYTKLDPLFNGKYEKTEREKPYVVWAPTHGYNNKHRGRSSYPQCMKLINEIPNCYESTVALHPTSRLNSRQKHNVTMQELLDADVVIADAGSTLYEAWALGKPVIFPDWLCRDDVLGHFEPGNLEYEIYKKRIGYHAKDMKHLIGLIDTALGHGMREPEIEFMEQIFPSRLRGKAGETAAKVLMQIREGRLYDAKIP